MRRLDGSQWLVLGMLLATIGLEFAFSPYWNTFVQNTMTLGEGAERKIKVTNEGLMVLAFLLFAIILLLLLTGVNARAGYAVAGLLLLSVVLARAQPIIDWLDATTAVLKKASGS